MLPFGKLMKNHQNNLLFGGNNSARGANLVAY